MHALIVDTDAGFADRIAVAFRKAGVEARTAQDGAEAAALLRSPDVGLLVTEWLVPTVDGMALVRQARGTSGGPPAVVCTVLSQREAREYAIRAGATEFLSKPIQAEAVARAALSVLRARRAGEVRPSGWEAGDALVAKAVWRDVPKTVTQLISEATGIGFAAAKPHGTFEWGASLGMIDVAKGIQLETALYAGPPCGRDLAKAMLDLDEASEEDVTELLMELCNQTLGVLKTSLRDAELLFTLSVPNKARVPPIEELASQFAFTRCLALAGTKGAQLGVLVGIRSIGARIVEVRELRENMVLAEDLTSSSGLLLLSAGTRLTSTTIARLRSQGQAHKVHVAA